MGEITKERPSVSKLVLGTVQFGCDYGINSAGRPSEYQVGEILKECLNHEITMLDTSSAYGDSEKVLGHEMPDKEKFRIISKYPKCSLPVFKKCENSLKDIGVDSLYGYLLHHFHIYAGYPEIWRYFIELKESGKVENIGFSLYSTQELDRILRDGIPFDIVQIPYNIFDRQFDPYLERLNDMGVQVHVRSTFLQGLFFKDRDSLSPVLEPLKKYLITLDDYAREHNMTIAEIALTSNIQNPYIDGVLIGVDNNEQLMENIRSIKEIPVDFHTEIKEKELLNPVNWK